ncbi:uncharacterized protein TNCV_1606101 [Trichonephila clavipes]|nr:uncharacterized protein TNCV_1606101 [Trichonephila clavipes]
MGCVKSIKDHDPHVGMVWKFGEMKDLVTEVDGNLFIIDVTIPFENGKVAFAEARQRKITKCQPLIEFFKGVSDRNVSIIPIVIGSLSSWDSENDSFLRRVATKSYLSALRKLCVSDCIRWSNDIYTQHLTGVQKYGSDTVVPVHIMGSTEASATTSHAASASESLNQHSQPSSQSNDTHPHIDSQPPLTPCEGGQL